MTQRLRFAGLALSLAWLVPMAYPQASSQITGQVTDATGAVVPGAEISVSNLETGAERSGSSGEQGSYTIPALPPGTYSVAVTKEGFRSVVREGVRLEVNQTGRIDFQLEVGSVVDTIEVSEAAPLIESDTSSIGQVIETKAIDPAIAR